MAPGCTVVRGSCCFSSAVVVYIACSLGTAWAQSTSIFPASVAALAPSPAPGPEKAVAGSGTASTAQLFPFPSYLSQGTDASNAVVEWNTAAQWVVEQSDATNLAPRVFAFLHLGIWQALKVNNATRTPANPTAVVGYASQLVLKNWMPLYFDKYNALLTQQTQGLSALQLQKAEAVANPIVVKLLSSRLADGFQQLPPVSPSAGGMSGEFLDTGTDLAWPMQQYAVTEPLLLPADLYEVEFMANCSAPPAVPSEAYNIQYTSTYLYGQNDSIVRSSDQTDTAMFWEDGGPGTSGIIGQWNRLLLSTLPASLTIDQTAEALAQLNVGLYDSTIAIFSMKYEFERWRPVTGIRNGDPDHAPEPGWTPLLTTPNSPTYPSVGSAYAGLAEILLQNFYGRDTVIFSVGTENTGPGGVLLPNRVYESFTQVGTEVVQSQYFGGVEFPVDGVTGRALGNDIAEYLLENFDALDPA